jgi:hypothetical protein
MIAWKIKQRNQGNIDAVRREEEVIGRCFIQERGRIKGFGTRIGTGQRNILKLTGVPEFADVGRGNGQNVSPRLVNGRVLFSLHDNILKK